MLQMLGLPPVLSLVLDREGQTGPINSEAIPPFPRPLASDCKERFEALFFPFFISNSSSSYWQTR